MGLRCYSLLSVLRKARSPCHPSSGCQASGEHERSPEACPRACHKTSWKLKHSLQGRTRISYQHTLFRCLVSWWSRRERWASFLAFLSRQWNYLKRCAGIRPTAWKVQTQPGSGKHLPSLGSKERALFAALYSACQTQKPNKNKRINESNPDCPEPGCQETHSSCSSGRSNSLHRSKKEEEKLFKSQETKSPQPSFKEGKLLDCSLKDPEEKTSKGSS